MYQAWRNAAYPRVEQRRANEAIDLSRRQELVRQKKLQRLPQPFAGTIVSAANVLPTSPEFIPQVILPITRKYGIPDPVAAAQFAIEGRGKGLGASRNNFFNLGAIDTNPGNAYSYKTPQEGVEAYAKFLTAPTWANGRQNIAPRFFNDPLSTIKQIEEQGYAGDKNTYKQRAKNNFDRYWKFAISTPEWKTYSQK